MDIVRSYIAEEPPPKDFADTIRHKEVPVHIHIPKCGGTFIRRALSDLLRVYCITAHKIIPVKQGAVILIGEEPTSVLPYAGYAQNGLIAYCALPNTEYKPPKPPGTEKENMLYRMPVEDFIREVKSGNLDFFALSATSVLLRREQAGDLEKIERELIGTFKLRYFTSLRDPFERAKSLYYVYKKRDPFMPCFFEHSPSVKEFSAFLLSHYSEPNWVSCFLAYVFRNGTQARPNDKITKDTFNTLIQTMTEKVKVAPMGDIGGHLRDLFSEAYSPYLGEFAVKLELAASDEYLNRATKELDFKPKDVQEACLKEFKNANSYDIALFEKFAGSDENE